MRAVRGIRGATIIVAWLLALPMVAFALLRLVGATDRSSRLFAIETLTPLILAPEYLVVVLAALTRAKLLAAVGVALVLLQLVWVAPDVRWWPEEDDRAVVTGFEIAAANVNAGNRRYDDVWDELMAVDAEVVVLTELTPAALAAFDARGRLDEYPHGIDDPRPGHFGTAILSRFPVEASEVLELAGTPMATATLDVVGAPVQVVAVHTRQPLASLTQLRTQLRLLGGVATDPGHATVLAGDFNATRQHAPFRALLESGLRDAHLETGRGRSRTWPVDSRVPAFALLDHVLVTDELVVRSTSEVTLPGSDHRAVVAGLGTTGR